MLGGRKVNRCFKAFERFVARRADKATRVLGPLFLALAVGLISLSAFCFFEAVFPEVFLSAEVPRWQRVLGTTWCSYLVLMMAFHYYLAVVTHPGSPLDPPRRLPPPQPIPLIGPLLLQLVTRDSTRSATAANGSRAVAVREVRAAQEKERRRQAERAPERRAAPAASTEGEAEPIRAERYARSCKKCPPIASGGRPPKPERTHHCSVCEQCILKFDHHCPWIKGCVGLHNERYFVLFLCYFSVSALFAAYWGLKPTLRCLNFFSGDWNHRTPRVLMLLTEVLALVMGLAVLVMCLSQLHLVARNQTNVESNDNEWYRKVALSRGRTFLNPYDRGWKVNLREFFNVGGPAAEGRYHWASILLPLAIPPASDGWSWKKRRNWREHCMEAEDELTDEEEPSGDEDVDER
ncbi:DHHC palmitoyltransferase-domain-containing protein [Rhodotorula diobovata]|uniref:Palmitoyltransferase n=1 Tax=Rhodotorula diobovata TaxID=5288 RepID=A0A5C5G365_9BASI|nr:DHHC palmitoyltransferase-domain-containing protein [Rhodotorula diobovata]